jgi:hypothetical protein
MFYIRLCELFATDEAFAAPDAKRVDCDAAAAPAQARIV